MAGNCQAVGAVDNWIGDVDAAWGLTLYPFLPEPHVERDMMMHDIAPASDAAPLFFEAHIFVCCNARALGHARGSCAAKGSERLRDYMKARSKELGLQNIRVNSAGCLDRCELGPCVVIYPEGVWYKIETNADVDRVLQVHVRDGGRVSDLVLPPR